MTAINLLSACLKFWRKISGFLTTSDSQRGLGGENRGNQSLLAFPFSFLIDYKDHGSHQSLSGKWVTETFDTNLELLLTPGCFWCRIIAKIQTVLLAIWFQLLSPGIQVVYLGGEKTLACLPLVLHKVLSSQIRSGCSIFGMFRLIKLQSMFALQSALISGALLEEQQVKFKHGQILVITVSRLQLKQRVPCAGIPHCD